jgi:hypothetical protein
VLANHQRSAPLPLRLGAPRARCCVERYIGESIKLNKDYSVCLVSKFLSYSFTRGSI